MMDQPFRIEQHLTTPSRPGKQPRPVWVAVGITHGYEQAFVDAGGRRYRGLWSFFRDPTDQLATAESQSFAERQESAQDRAADRAERYEGYASNAAGRSQSAASRRHEIADGIPLGQPILVGHHSEQHARRDVARMDSLIRKEIDESGKASHWAHRAKVADRKASGEHSVGFMVRRRDEALAEVRKLQRQIDNRDLNSRYYPVLSDAQRARVAVVRAEYQERADYWQQRIDAAGGLKFGPHNIQVGDCVRAGGFLGVVIKVNAKTVKVQGSVMPYPLTYRWDDVTEAVVTPP